MWIPADCQPTTLELAREFREPGFIFEEKMDGIRAICEVGEESNRVTGRRLGADGKPAEITKTHAAYLRSVRFAPHYAGCVFDGELMPDGSYAIFDCLQWKGEDLRNSPLLVRKFRLLDSVFVPLPEFVSRVQCFHSWKRMEYQGFGEGVVIKDMRSKYGFGWWKAKRVETEDVFALSIDRANGVADVGCGKVSGVPQSVNVGDCIEVEFFKRFESGKLRNGKFLRLRDDKPGYNDGQHARVSESGGSTLCNVVADHAAVL